MRGLVPSQYMAKQVHLGSLQWLRILPAGGPTAIAAAAASSTTAAGAARRRIQAKREI